MPTNWLTIESQTFRLLLLLAVAADAADVVDLLRRPTLVMKKSVSFRASPNALASISVQNAASGFLASD